MKTLDDTTNPPTRKKLIQISIALFVTMACWSLSNPPGSTPDEWFQLGSIWCANGADGNHCDAIIPGYVINKLEHGVADIDESSCLISIRSSIAQCVPAKFGAYLRNGGGYPVGFHKIMNLFVPIGKSLNVLSMRIFNSSIAIGLLVAQLLLSNRRVRISHLTAFTLTIFPMSIFLISSIHPSGWALTGVSNGWLFLIAATSKPRLERWKQWLAWAGWVLCVVLCLTSRYEAFLYFIASNFIALFATRITKHKINWKLVIPSVVAASIGLLALLQYNQISRWVLKFPIKPEAGRIENGQWITHWLLQTIAIPVEVLGTGLIGQRPLRIPDIVWIVGIACLGGALLFSFVKSSAIQLITFCGSLMMLSFIIMSFNGRQERDFFNLSGRYIIPLVPFIVGLCIYLSKSPVQMMEILRLRILVITLLSTTHAIALHSVIETYVDGQSYAFLPINVGETGWWWIGLPFGPNFVVILGSICFFKFLSLIWSTVPTVQIEVTKFELS
jgi:hypothetical protein